jgi:hypothetical protein
MIPAKVGLKINIKIGIEVFRAGSGSSMAVVPLSTQRIFGGFPKPIFAMLAMPPARRAGSAALGAIHP